MESTAVTNKTYPAPALGRGIEVFLLLQKESGLSLEQIAEYTKYPKSSVLRMLATLQQLKLIERHPVTRLYAVTQRLATIKDNSLNKKVSIELERLCAIFQKTVEWYEYNGKTLELVDRQEPERAINLLAKIGFERRLDDEFDCLARLGLAFFGGNIDYNGFWFYDVDGKKSIVGDVKTAVKEARENSVAFDLLYNAYGVRRLAAVVADKNQAYGIISIAETCYPGAERTINIKLEQLKESADSIVEAYRKNDISEEL